MSLRWYQFRPVPAVVVGGFGLVLLLLNLFPRTMADMNEVYPGAGVKPEVREFGFPATAVSTVSTVPTKRGYDPYDRPAPTGVTIEYASSGPKLVWLASTKQVTFKNGSTTHVSDSALLVDVAVNGVLLVVVLALGKWWSNRRSQTPGKS